MTLPASGPLSYNNFNTEAGIASGTAIDMAWIYNNTKSGQQSYSLSNYYGKAWYQYNVGNCNNGNCNCGNCNCYDFPANCVNCYGTQCINCANCDTRSWFQNNCNCYAQCYNCNYNVWQANCNCNCDCVCACCFPGDTLVTMADGSLKRIDEILVGDYVDGSHGYKNRVMMYHKIKAGYNKVYIINGRHRTTTEHKHLTTDGWACIDPHSYTTKKLPLLMTVDNDGRREWHSNRKCTRTPTLELVVGMTLLTTEGEELIDSIELDTSFNPDEFLYTLRCDGSHTHIASGNIVVGAWTTDYDFDYETWTQIEPNEEAIHDDKGNSTSASTRASNPSLVTA